MKADEDTLYKEALKHMNELADQVFKECEWTAEYYKYELSWVVYQFRNAFNSKTKDMKG